MKYPKVVSTLLGICLLGMPLAVAGGESRSCRAVVIGISNYPGTKARALAGARSDAEIFTEACRRRGMQVTTLLDEEATRANILKALRAGDSSQTVLVYYSGYGSGPSEPRLLCADTSQNEKGGLDNALTLQELDKTLTALPSKERICILDACFSAARASKDGPSEEVVRYYVPRKNARELAATAYDIPGVSHDKVRYICASRYNEEALEGSVDGRQGGLFTSLLCQALKEYPNSTWQALQVQVASKLNLLAEDRQHPVFAESALASRVPGSSDQLPVSADNPGTPDHPSPTRLGAAQNWGGPPTSAWDVFAADVRDPQTVRVSVSPDKDAIRVGQPIELKISVGKPGYLLVVNHGSEDKINTLFPLSGLLDDALVKSGDTIQIPGPSLTLSPDRPGQERVKAFLFATREKGQEFFQSMQASTGVPFKQAATKLGGRSLVFGTVAEEGRAPMNTSDISIQVIP
ncbi:MAG: caspase family protein [Vulcanimicrobiota bacterium]